jgi:phosphonate transport system substrate-binding protein
MPLLRTTIALIASLAWLGAAEPLLFNVLPLEAPVEMAKKFTPFTAYLSKALGTEIQIKTGKDYPTCNADIGSLKHQFAYTSPAMWTKLVRQYPEAGLEMVALVCVDGKPVSHACIVVAKDSPVQDIAALKGKTFAFGSEASLGSHIYPRYMLKQGGIECEGGLASFKFTGSHANVLKSVVDGRADAGGLIQGVAKKGVEAGTVRILATSDPIPEFAIIINKSFPADAKAKLLAALIALNATKPDDSAILAPIGKGVTGFVQAKGDEYKELTVLIGKIYGDEYFTKP